MSYNRCFCQFGQIPKISLWNNSFTRTYSLNSATESLIHEWLGQLPVDYRVYHTMTCLPLRICTMCNKDYYIFEYFYAWSMNWTDDALFIYFLDNSYFIKKKNLNNTVQIGILLLSKYCNLYILCVLFFEYTWIMFRFRTVEYKWFD